MCNIRFVNKSYTLWPRYIFASVTIIKINIDLLPKDFKTVFLCKGGAVYLL